MPAVFIIGFIILVIAMIAVSAAMAAKRRKELSEWAAAHGLSFSEGRDSGFDDRFGFACLKRGDDRYAYNIMRGEWRGRPAVMFDYHYETELRDSKGKRQTHNHYFSAVAVGAPFWLADLAIRPEGWFDKVGEFFGMDDIDFESAEFSRTFHVKASDRKWAYDVLHARAMQMLLDSPRYSLEFKGEWALLWETGTFSTAQFESAANVGANLFEMFPEYLVQQYRGPSRSSNVN